MGADLDRLAKAAYEQWKLDTPELGTLEPDRFWETEDEWTRELGRNKVRAILQELREPSTAMVLAGRQAAKIAVESWNEAEWAFTAMIDHILKEEP